VFKIVHLPEVKWTLCRKFPALFFCPHMERKEFVLFKKLCRNKTVFLEYGSGGSTIHLVKSKKVIFSVESNPDFYKYMLSMRIIKRALKRDLQYKFINLGDTNKWGKPLNLDRTENWPQYYEKIWQVIDPVIHRVDVVFIDGRFRVSCCLYSILKAIEYNWNDIIFIIHDFWRREKYHVVLNFLLEISSAENLVAFRMKRNIAVHEVKELLEEYSLVVA